MAFAKTATEHRGTANRVHRNMLVFLAADVNRMEELETRGARLPRLVATSSSTPTSST